MLLLEGCDLVVVVAGRREKENGELKRGSQGKASVACSVVVFR